MKLRAIFKIVSILFLCSSAYADYFHTMVRYQCNKTSNTLSILYLGAYNENGEEMLSSKGIDDFDPQMLLETQDGNFPKVVKIKSETRICNLSNETYKVVISGSPGNYNILGRCGGQMSAQVAISKDDKTIFEGRFEGDCHSKDPVLTQIVIRSGQQPKLTKVSQNDFYQ